MNLLHLGDLHLGKSLADFDLIEDQEFILNQILDITKDREVDAVLIAGDVYDRSIPSEAAVNLLDSFLQKLADNRVAVFIISGNHDSDDRLNFGSSFFESNRIYISGKFDGKMHCHTMNDAFGEINIYLLPFVKASQVRHYFPEEKIESYEDAVNLIINNTGIDAGKRNVIVAHQFVAGRNADPELGGSEGMSAQSVGLVEKIGCDSFDAFDYAALGHIHSPQKIGRDTVRYSGSPLKYSLKEIDNEKSVPLVTFREKGDVTVELIPLKPMREMRHLKGPIEKLLSKDNFRESDDFIYVTLTNEEIINDAMAVFQQYYPCTIKIDYDNSHTCENEQVDIARIVENKSFSELIGEFYQMIYGHEMSDEEMSIMRDAAKEAGVIKDETD